jgi:hypothetical protein
LHTCENGCETGRVSTASPIDAPLRSCAITRQVTKHDVQRDVSATRNEIEDCREQLPWCVHLLLKAEEGEKKKFIVPCNLKPTLSGIFRQAHKLSQAKLAADNTFNKKRNIKRNNTEKKKMTHANTTSGHLQLPLKCNSGPTKSETDQLKFDFGMHARHCDDSKKSSKTLHGLSTSEIRTESTLYFLIIHPFCDISQNFLVL